MEWVYEMIATYCVGFVAGLLVAAWVNTAKVHRAYHRGRCDGWDDAKGRNKR